MEKLGSVRNAEGVKVGPPTLQGAGQQVEKEEQGTGQGLPQSNAVGQVDYLIKEEPQFSPPNAAETEVVGPISEELGKGQVLPSSGELIKEEPGVEQGVSQSGKVDCPIKEEPSEVRGLPPSGAVTDIGEIKLRPSEKKKVRSD